MTCAILLAPALPPVAGRPCEATRMAADDLASVPPHVGHQTWAMRRGIGRADHHRMAMDIRPR